MKGHIPSTTQGNARRVGQHFADWRKLNGLKIAEVAERAGVSVNTIRSLEAGQGGTSLLTLLAVARVLGIDDLLSEALDPYNTERGRALSADRLPQRVRR